MRIPVLRCRQLIPLFFLSVLMTQANTIPQSGFVIVEAGQPAPYSLSTFAPRGKSLPTLTESSDEASDINALKLSSPTGLGRGITGIQLQFDQAENFHDFWKVKYRIKSLTNVSNVAVAFELVLESKDHPGESLWIQKKEHRVKLSDAYQSYLDVEMDIHSSEFERSSANNGSHFELTDVVGINLYLITDTDIDQDITILLNAIEFYDISPYAGLTSSMPQTVVPSVTPTPLSQFMGGSPSRMGVFVSDTNSSWLSLVVALKNMGIPVAVHTNIADALSHEVLVIYPEVSSNVFSPEESTLLKNHAQDGGTLIGFHVKDVLHGVFGIASSHNIASDPAIRDIKFTTTAYPDLTGNLEHSFEKRISIFRRTADDTGDDFCQPGPRWARQHEPVG